MFFRRATNRHQLFSHRPSAYVTPRRGRLTRFEPLEARQMFNGTSALPSLATPEAEAAALIVEFKPVYITSYQTSAGAQDAAQTPELASRLMEEEGIFYSPDPELDLPADNDSVWIDVGFPLQLTADGRNSERQFIKSWSTSGDADDRPTEEVAFYYNKIAFNYSGSAASLNLHLILPYIEQDNLYLLQEAGAQDDAKFLGGIFVAVGDVNGDGRPDVLARLEESAGEPPQIIKLGTFDPGDRDGKFVAVWNPLDVNPGSTPPGVWSLTVAAGDFNGDGRPDLAFCFCDGSVRFISESVGSARDAAFAGLESDGDDMPADAGQQGIIAILIGLLKD